MGDVYTTLGMTKRINVTLRNDTLELIDEVAPRGDRSRFIDRAVWHYVQSVGRKNLDRLLREGAKTNSDRDLAMARDWFDLENETWPNAR